MGPVPPVPATQPQYFDIPLTEPINQGASAAHFLPQQPMEGPLVPERWMFPGAALSQSVRPGVAQSQYFDLPLTQPINHGAPVAGTPGARTTSATWLKGAPGNICCSGTNGPSIGC